MSLLDFLKRVGKFLAKALSIVKQVVPEEVLVLAVAEARKYVNSTLTNAAKREAVVRALAAKFPQIPESVIRLAVELAVQILKREANEALDKV